MKDTTVLDEHFTRLRADDLIVTPTGKAQQRLADALAATGGGGVAIPNASLLGGNGTSLTAIGLGANLSLSGGVLSATSGFLSGLVGDGVTDNTATLQAALDAIPITGGTIRLPAGNFVVAGALTAGGRSIALEGAGLGITTLIQTHTGIGLTITQTNVIQKVSLSGITMRASAAGGPCAAAVAAAWPHVPSAAESNWTVVDCEFHSTLAASSTGYPSTYTDCLRLKGAWLAHMIRAGTHGPASLTAPAFLIGTSFARLDDCYDVDFTGCKIFNVEAAVHQRGYCEGVSFTSCSVIANSLMVQDAGFPNGQASPNAFTLLGLWITDCEINNAFAGVAVSGVQGGQIVSTDIARWAGTTLSDFVAIHYTDCRNLVHSANEIIGGGSDTPTFAHAKGIVLDGATNNCRFDGSNLIANCSVAVSLGAGTSYNRILDVGAQDATTSTFTDAGSNNVLSWVQSTGARTQVGTRVYAGSSGQSLLAIADVAGAVNIPTIFPSVSGAAVSLIAAGETNVDMDVRGSGTGRLKSGGNVVIHAGNIGTGLSWSGTTLTATGGSGGFAPGGTTLQLLSGTGSNVTLAARLSIASGTLDLAQQSATSGQVLAWNGSGWAPLTPTVYAPLASPTFTGTLTSAGAFGIAGAGTDIGYTLTTKGQGGYAFNSSTSTLLNVGTSGAGQVNYPLLVGAPTGNAVSIGAAGADANVALVLQPKGAAGVYIGGSVVAVLASPAFTGTPTVPTAAAGTNTTQIASTAFVSAAVAASTVGVASFQGRTGTVTLTSADVTGALSFTPYNATNPAGYQTASQVSSAISAAAYALPNATTSILGGVIVGAGLGVSSGTVSVSYGTGSGTAAQGNDSRITGALAASAAAATYAPLASPTFTGTVTIPAGASISGFAPLASPALTGAPTAPTAAVDTNTTQLATTAMVLAQAASATPLVDGTAVAGASTRFARADHVHPTDTSRLAAASNLLDLASASSARTNLGLATVAASGAISDTTGTLAVARGGTGAPTAQLARVAVNQGITALTSGSSVATDASLGNVFTLTLATNATLANPTNMVTGASYAWIITQDGTGSRTLAYGTAFTWPGGTAGVLSTAAGAVDILTAIYDGSKLRANLSKGYA